MTTSPQPISTSLEPVHMRWPAAFQPESAQVLLQSEFTADAPLPVVWAWLLRAGDWPSWYVGAASVHFLSHTGPDLRDRSRFRWKTAHLRLTCKVLEFEPPVDALTPARLAWDGRGLGLELWHAWLLTPVPNGRTHLRSEQVRHGWMARLQNRLLPGRSRARQRLWLEALNRQAQTGMPHSPSVAANATEQESAARTR